MGDRLIGARKIAINGSAVSRQDLQRRWWRRIKAHHYLTSLCVVSPPRLHDTTRAGRLVHHPPNRWSCYAWDWAIYSGRQQWEMRKTNCGERQWQQTDEMSIKLSRRWKIYSNFLNFWFILCSKKVRRPFQSGTGSVSPPALMARHSPQHITAWPPIYRDICNCQNLTRPRCHQDAGLHCRPSSI